MGVALAESHMEIHPCAELEALAGMFMPGAAPAMVFQTSHPIRCLLFPAWSFPCLLSLGGRWSSWMVHQNSPHQWVQKGKREDGAGACGGAWGSASPLLERLQVNELTVNPPAFCISTSPFFSSHLVRGCNLCCVCPFTSHYILNERRDETYSLFKASKIGLINMSN